MAALARWQRTIVDNAGNILPGATVQVNNEAGGALATLYSDRAGTTTIGNPFTADAITAFAAFHVVGGAYQITVTSGAFSQTWRYVGIGTLQEVDLAGSSSLYRTPLLADATIYVSPSGSDSTGDGTSGNPYKTPQFAALLMIASLDFRNHTITIQFADGDYPDNCTLSVDNVGGGSLIFNGNAASPGNVRWTGQLSCTLIKSVKVQNMTVSNITADAFSQITLGVGLIFAQTAGTHLFAKSLGLISIGASYTVGGGALYHMRANNATMVAQFITITMTINSPLSNFVVAFADAENTGVLLVNGNTFIPSSIDSPGASATGLKFMVISNGVIQTGSGANPNYFPGSSNGTPASGGQYI